MNDNKVVERYSLEDGEWSTVVFEELVKDDVFRIFINGIPYADEHGKMTWVAKSDVHLNEYGESVIDVYQSE